jgi:hypothetical protein
VARGTVHRYPPSIRVSGAYRVASICLRRHYSANTPMRERESS